MPLDVRREGAKRIDGHHALAASTVLIGAVALADVRAAALALTLIAPLLLLAKRGNATLRISQLSVDEASPLGSSLRRAGTIALVEAEGPLLFLSVPSIDRILPAQPPWPEYVIVDLRAVPTIDASALTAVRDLLHELRRDRGEFLLVCTPGSSIQRCLVRSGLAARALGGTTCFRLEHALTRIAARHPDVEDERNAPVAQRPALYLVPSATAPRS